MGTETGIEMGKIRIVDKNELVEKGKGIYKKIKDRLKPAHKGEVIAIEVKDYSLGNSVIEADRKARGRYPDEIFYFGNVGYRTLYVRR